MLATCKEYYIATQRNNLIDMLGNKDFDTTVWSTMSFYWWLVQGFEQVSSFYSYFDGNLLQETW